MKRASRVTAYINASTGSQRLGGQLQPELGSYVNTVAQGDDTIVIASGGLSYETTNTPDYSAPAVPIWFYVTAM